MNNPDLPAGSASSPPPKGVLALLAVAIVGTAVWLLRSGSEGVSVDDLLTAEVGQGDIEETVTALGNLQPRDYVDVGAQVSGQLKKIYVAIGDTVQQGDLVAEIDAVVLSSRVEATRAQLVALRAQLVDREAQVGLAQDKFQRQVQLRNDDATSEEAFNSAKAALDSARAQLDVLKAQIQQSESSLKGDSATLGYSKIYAPMSGTVVSLTAREGQTLNANQVAPIILRIADLSTMTVWTQVSEADVPKLRDGMMAYFTTLGRPDRRWSGTLRQILPTPELVNNVVLYTALFDVDNPDGELKTQMSAQVFFIVAAAHDVVTVPVAALQPYRPPSPGGAQSGESVDRNRDSGGRAAALRDGVPFPEGGAENGGRRLREGFGREGGPRAGTPLRVPGHPRPQLVRVIDAEGRIEERRVVIGVSNRVTAEVLEGLTPGEVVVTGEKTEQPPPQVGPQRGPGGGFRGF